MKYSVAIPALLLQVFLAMCASKVEAASNELHARAVEHRLTLREVAEVTNALPEIQTLWPDQAEAYEQCVNHALVVLSVAPSNEVAIQASRRLFSNIAGTSISTNREHISSLNREAIPSLLSMKCRLILHSLGSPAIREDIATWLNIASVVGELRSQIIPNYVAHRNVKMSALTEGSQEAAERVRTENDKKVAIDAWQWELRATDRRLTFILLGGVQTVSPKLTELQREQFVARTISLARLNEVESRELIPLK